MALLRLFDMSNGSCVGIATYITNDFYTSIGGIFNHFYG